MLPWNSARKFCFRLGLGEQKETEKQENNIIYDSVGLSFRFFVSFRKRLVTIQSHL